MKKYLILTAIITSLIICAFSTVYAAGDDLTLDVELEYGDDGALLVISGESAVKYIQNIMIVVYEPTLENGLAGIREDDGNLPDDPAMKEPLTDPTKILRMYDTLTDKDGRYEMSVPMDTIANGQYIIVKVSGGGSQKSTASVLRYYETQSNLENVTIPAFESATADELGGLLKEKELLLGITLGEDYEENKEEIHNIFVKVRTEDFVTDSQTRRKFNSLDDILKALDMVEGIRSLPDETTSDDVLHFIGAYGDLTGYDFSTGNDDYTLTKSESINLVAETFREKSPESMSEINRVITQCVGISMMNSKDSTTIAPVVEKYGVILGIDKTDYELYCEKYTAYEVNKAFVNRNFKKPEEVVAALSERISDLEDKTTSGSSGGSGSGSGGGGGGGSSYLGTVTVEPEKEQETETTPVIPENKTYSDVTEAHWAYDAVRELSEKNIISGFEDGSFRPGDTVTREQFVKLIAMAFGFEPDGTDTDFTDVDSSRWSAIYINAASRNGIVNGVTDTEFMPENGLIRQDAAVILARVCDKKGIKLSGKSEVSDAENISEYAKDSVLRLAGAGIVSGFEDGTFRPMQVLTRAEAAKLIYGLIKR